MGSDLMPRPAFTLGLSGEEIAARLDTVLLEIRDPQELQALPGACLGTPAIVELGGRLYLYHGGFSGEILDAEFLEEDEP